MYDLASFTLRSMTQCGAALRRLGAGADSMEQAAGRIVRYLRESFVNPRTGRNSFVLVRLFRTLPHDALDESQRRAVAELLGAQPLPPDLKCLTLLATAGDRPEWNSRLSSARHRAIPLGSEGMVARSPMITRLVHQLGLSLGHLLRPEPDLIMDLEQRTYNVFHVPEARLSPHVPDQEGFVIPHAVRSSLGFGGMLPSGDLFAVIGFSRDPIERDTANLFKPLALSTKIALLPFAGGPIFDGPAAARGPAAGSAGADPGPGRLRSHVAALEQLIDVQDQAVVEQSARLEAALEEIGRHAADLERSERTLKEQTLILQSILDSMSDGVVVADAAGKFLHFNPAAERLVGLGAIDAPPGEWSERYGLFLPDGETPFPTERLPLVRALRGEPVDEAEIFVRRPGPGPGAWLSVNSRPLCDETGAARGAVAVFRDVSGRILADQAAAHHAAQLARSNAELTQFAYVASHDLQEPLRMIRSYADLLARRYRGRLDAEAEQFIAYITSSADRLSDLIRDLLTLSRVGAGNGSSVAADGQAIYEQAVANLRAAIESERAVLSSDPLPAVRGDPVQLVQLFQNLIGNAVKFHGEAPPRVHVSAARAGDETVFSVRDDGIGIDPAQSETIFAMFTRLHGRNAYPGTGIGLAICRKIVEGHGGRIWVESRPGEGATFYFTIPLEGETHDRSIRP